METRARRAHGVRSAVFAQSAGPPQRAPLEVGALLGAGCAGGGACTDGGVLAGVAATVWASRNVEVGLRLTRLGGPDREIRISRDGRFSTASTPAVRDLAQVDARRSNRQRIMMNVLFAYHARPDADVRPFVGVLAGERMDRARHSCEPAGCEELLARLIGPEHTRRSGAGAVIGFSGVAGPIGWRAGFACYMPFGEPDQEGFVQIGWRF
jgi:hypothetical protein